MFPIKKFRLSRRKSVSARNRRAWLNLETLDDRIAPAVFTVVNTLDNLTEGSLRWAVTQANQNPGADSIVFDQNLGGTLVEIFNDLVLYRNAPPATITLGTALSITGELSITGNHNLTISGGNTSQIFVVPAGSSLSLNGMNLSAGAAAGFTLLGGAIRNDGTLSMTNSSIAASVALFGGGALFNNGTATIASSRFTGNISQYGAAIYNDPGSTLNVTSTIFSTNRATQAAGAILNSGTAAISNSQFTGNTAPQAGAIYNDVNTTLTITTSTLSGNTAVAGGGALVVGGGTVTIERSQILSNSATGNAGAAGQAGVAGQAGGSAVGGGIVVTAGSLRVVETTIAGNIARGGHGGDGFHGADGSAGPDGPTPQQGASAIAGNPGQPGQPGQPGTSGGAGGIAAGGGLYIQGGQVVIVGSTLSDNQAIGGRGGFGGNGGHGGDGGDGSPAVPPRIFLPGWEFNFFSGGAGGLGGEGGDAGRGGAGGDAFGGAVALSTNSSSLVLANATLAGNGVQGGNGSRGGNGGSGGDGGNGGSSFPVATSGGSGGAGGNGGDGSITGPAGSGVGSGLYQMNGTVVLRNATIAYNAAAMGLTVTTVPTGGTGGAAGANGPNRTGFVAPGTPGQPGSLSTVTPVAAGGGISTQRDGSSTFSAANSIVALNTAGGVDNDVAGTLLPEYNLYNLFGTGGSGGLAAGTNGNLVNVANPGLLPLASNGGLTRTIAIQQQSPARNSGFNAFAHESGFAPLTTDQRGAGFPRIVGATVDMGAYEAIEIQESLVVTTLADEDDGTSDPRFGTGTSLREALAWSNRNFGAETITFATGLTGTITLTRGELSISDNLSIVGPGASSLTISGNDSNRIFSISDGIDWNLIDVSLEGMTLTRGRTSSGLGGGAISARENLTLTRMVLAGNRVDPGTSQAVGGAVAQIGLAGISLRVVESTISNNQSGSGGGLYLSWNDSGERPKVEIIRSTFSGNSTTGDGAAIWSSRNLTVVNSTFSGNVSSAAGGVLYQIAASASLTHVTIVGNGSLGGAIKAVSGAAVRLENSILSGYVGPQVNLFNVSTVIGAGKNIVQGGLSGVAGIIDADPLLGPLADNGGPTLTHRPAWGSPATNAGAPVGGPTTDQRGRLRSATTPTLGAVEGPSIRINSTSIDLGTTVYGQPGPAASFEIEAYGLNRQTQSNENHVFVGAIAGLPRPTEWDYSLDGTNWLSSIEEWPGYGFELSPDVFLYNSKITVYVRLLKGATVGSTFGNFSVRSDFYASGGEKLLPYTGEITPATLTFTANPARRAYGDANPALDGTLSGFLFQDTLERELVNPTGNPPTITTTATTTSGAGSYPITGNYLLKNYVVAQAPANATALTIDRRELVVRGVSTSKIQGEANPAFAVNYTGFVLNDGPGSLGGSLTFSTAATASSLPGSYLFTPGGLASNNYDIRFVSGGLTVLSYSQATATLLDQVNATAMRSTLRLSLAGTLNLAIQAFDTGDTVSGMNQLSVFIDTLLRSDRSLSPTTAQNWIAYARRIRRAWNPNL